MKNSLTKRFSIGLAAIFLMATATGWPAENGFLREIWHDLRSSVEKENQSAPAFVGQPFRLTTDPAYYAAPPLFDKALGFGSPIVSRNYGARLRAWLVAPATGDYVFWDDGADTVVVYLSTDENPKGKRLILSEIAGRWDQKISRRPRLKSAPVRLTAGKKYYMEVIHTSGEGSAGLALKWQAPGDVRVDIPASALEPYFPPLSNPPGLTLEFFPGVPGNYLENLLSAASFYRLPARTKIITEPSIENLGKDYGVRLRAYLTAPTTGAYIFWECGNGDVSVCLGTDDNATAIHQSMRLNDRPNKREIAHHRGTTKPFEWTALPGQQSKPIQLIGGKRYYLEVLYKAGKGKDYLALAWQPPGAKPELLPLPALESYRRADTDLDDDRMPDALEREYGLDPTNAADAAGDIDGDGIFNDEAIQAGADPRVRGSVSGMVFHDMWKDRAGDSRALDERAFAAALSRPISVRSVAVSTRVRAEGKDCIRRLSGFLTAPVDGQYSFWAGANGDCAFYLSTTVSRADRQALIIAPGPNEYGRLDEKHKSQPVTLSAGEKYYFEFWHKQNGGQSTASLAWQIPGESRDYIASRFLSTYVGETKDVSDPKMAAVPVKVTDIPLDAFRAAPDSWTQMPGGALRSTTRRGAVEFSFTVDEPGIYLVELQASARATNGYPPSVPIIARVDGFEIGRAEIKGADERHRWFNRWLSPWLTAGTHTVVIDNRNVRSSVSLVISGLAILRHEGEDQNGNGIPDQLDAIVGVADHLEVPSDESATSPLCVEGKARYPGEVRISTASGELPTQPGLVGRWYVNVPLNPSGETKITGLFEGGTTSEERTVRWVATNLFAAPDSIKVRVGDSIKLTAVPPGADAGGMVVNVTRDGKMLEQSAEPQVVKFDVPGTVKFTATADSGAEKLEATVEVEVIEADFGAEFSVAAGSPRVWDLPKIPHMLVLEKDADLDVEEMDRKPSESRRLTVTYRAGQAGSPRLLARLWKDGPIAAATSLNAFRFVPASQTGDASRVNILSDGTQVFAVRYVLDGRIPRDLSIWIQLSIAGALFANGSSWYELTAADFDAQGQARLLIYKASGFGNLKVCHRIMPYLNDRIGK